MKRLSGASGDLGLSLETPGDSHRAPISVSALTSAIREVLEEGLGEIWVAGEISNFRSPGSGHLYFTLKDAASTISAVMFRTEAARIGFALQDGQAVLARGSITVYEARGQYQLQIEEIRARGQGDLQQRFEELKRRLQAEGLFELSRKRKLPLFPEVIGIITSLQGAVLQDMLRILQRRAPGIRIRVRGVRVQGFGAAQEIVDAIASFNSDTRIDLLVLARGGGSLEDLWSFNDEAVARALAACVVPTISAVGHETDFTIADLVADLRAPTPSAAAELLTRDWTEWREVISGMKTRLDREMRQSLVAQRKHLSRLAESYALREPRRVIRHWAQHLDDLKLALSHLAGQTILALQNRLGLRAVQLQAHQPGREITRRCSHLTHLAARLRALGPQATLDRGYALVLDSEGRPVTQALPSFKGQSTRVVLGRGVLEALVTQVDPAKTLENSLQPPAIQVPATKSRRKKPEGGK